MFCMMKLQVLCDILPQKSGLFTVQLFFTRMKKMVSFRKLDHLRKRCIPLIKIENDENQ